MVVLKSRAGNFFEDFSLGQVIEHATPRTITEGDRALYTALYGSRFAPQSSDEFARQIGYPRAPLDDFLVFHVAFGKTVPDISLNAIANLGYAECRFLRPVFAGDTLRARSQVIGLRESTSGDAGIVYVRSSGIDQNGETVLDYVRWVLVRKHEKALATREAAVPRLAERVAPETIAVAVPQMVAKSFDSILSGSQSMFEDYEIGETIDHVDGVTIEEAEHQLATRLYQNTAKVHFNADAQASSRFGRRIIYGGVVMSIVRALSFNGLANAFHVAAINGGRHVAPCFAGDTIYASSEIIEAHVPASRDDVGLLRVKSTASKAVRPSGARPVGEVATAGCGGEKVLELDVWFVIPRVVSAKVGRI